MSDSGFIVGPLENLRTLIANCAIWQTWTETADATTAREETYLLFPPVQEGETYSVEQLEVMRPFAVVDWFAGRRGTGGQSFNALVSASGLATGVGKVFVTIEANTPRSMLEKNEDAFLDFSRNVEVLVTEMLALAEGGGAYLIIESIELFTPPYRSPREDGPTIGDYWRTTLVVQTSPYPS